MFPGHTVMTKGNVGWTKYQRSDRTAGWWIWIPVLLMNSLVFWSLAILF